MLTELAAWNTRCSCPFCQREKRRLYVHGSIPIKAALHKALLRLVTDMVLLDLRKFHTATLSIRCKLGRRAGSPAPTPPEAEAETPFGPLGRLWGSRTAFRAALNLPLAPGEEWRKPVLLSPLCSSQSARCQPGRERCADHQPFPLRTQVFLGQYL